MVTTNMNITLELINRTTLVGKDFTSSVIDVHTECGMNQPFELIRVTVLKNEFEKAISGMEITEDIYVRASVLTPDVTSVFAITDIDRNDSICTISGANPLYAMKKIRLRDALRITTNENNTIDFQLPEYMSSNGYSMRAVLDTAKGNIRGDKTLYESEVKLFDSAGVGSSVCTACIIAGPESNPQYNISYISKIQISDFIHFAHVFAGDYFCKPETILSESGNGAIPVKLSDLPAHDSAKGLFTQQTIDDMRSGTNPPYWTKNLSSGNAMRFRLDATIWDVLNIYCTINEVYITASDKVNVIRKVSTSKDSLTLGYNMAESPDIISLSSSADCGEDYVSYMQKAVGENFTISVGISDSNIPNSIATTNTYYPDVESLYVPPSADAEEYMKQCVAERLDIHRRLALSNLIYNSKNFPYVSVQFSEVHPEIDVTYKNGDKESFSSYNELVSYSSAHPPADGSIATVQEVGFLTDYYMRENNQWIIIEDVKFIRTPKYNLYSLIEVNDTQNNVKLPCANILNYVFEYPSCTSTIYFGNSKISDINNKVDSLETKKSNTSDSGDENVNISNKYNAKVAVGNQPIEAIAPSNPIDGGRPGFTGLIQEKNWDANIYRLAGYKDGAVQAQFNSEGEIEAGAGHTKLNADGLSVYADTSAVNFNRQQALTISDKDKKKDDLLRIYACADIVYEDGVKRQDSTIINTGNVANLLRMYTQEYAPVGSTPNRINYVMFTNDASKRHISFPNISVSTHISDTIDTTNVTDPRTGKSSWSYRAGPIDADSIFVSNSSASPFYDVYNTANGDAIWPEGKFIDITGGVIQTVYDTDAYKIKYPARASQLQRLYHTKAGSTNNTPYFIDVDFYNTDVSVTNGKNTVGINAMLYLDFGYYYITPHIDNDIYNVVKISEDDVDTISIEYINDGGITTKITKPLRINENIPQSENQKRIGVRTSIPYYLNNTSKVQITKISIHIATGYLAQIYVPTYKELLVDTQLRLCDIQCEADDEIGGSEIRLWEDHISLCGNTKLVGTLDGNFELSKSAKDSIFRGNIENIFEKIYPVGSIYLSVDSNFNPSAVFGGEWILLAGADKKLALVAVNDANLVGSEFGNATHTLTESEMPRHNHSISIYSNGSHTHKVTISNGGGGGSNGFRSSNTDNGTIDTNSDGNHSHGASIGYKGNGTAFDIIPPSIGVFAWKKVASSHYRPYRAFNTPLYGSGTETDPYIFKIRRSYDGIHGDSIRWNFDTVMHTLNSTYGLDAEWVHGSGVESGLTYDRIGVGLVQALYMISSSIYGTVTQTQNGTFWHHIHVQNKSDPSVDNKDICHIGIIVSDSGE